VDQNVQPAQTLGGLRDRAIYLLSAGHLSRQRDHTPPSFGLQFPFKSV
jgi:hypothetical protein